MGTGKWISVSISCVLMLSSRKLNRNLYHWLNASLLGSFALAVKLWIHQRISQRGGIFIWNAYNVKEETNKIWWYCKELVGSTGFVVIMFFYRKAYLTSELSSNEGVDFSFAACLFVCLFCRVLWHINLCRLFNAKSIFM